MRNRPRTAWVDPRFATKKPKKIALNKFGEAAAPLPCKPPPKPCPRQAESCPRPSPGVSSRPTTAQRPRPPPLSLGHQLKYRPGSGLAQRPVSMSSQEACPRQPPPQPCPRQPPPQTCPRVSPPPCPREIPQPCPRASPPPCPREIPRRREIPRPGTSGLQRPQGIPRATGFQRPQETSQAPCPRRGASGLQQPSVRGYQSGLRAPGVSMATSVTARRLGEEPSGPCPSAPTTSTPAQRSIAPPGFTSRLQQPSRLMAPGSFLQRRKPQKIVLMPGDINPQETTVITVEPPAPRSGASTMQDAGSTWVPPSYVPFDLSPPSMSSYRRNEPMPEPYIPPEVAAMEYPASDARLIDYTMADQCSRESSFNMEPVDLMSFPPPDPFSPDRPVRPPSPSVSPPPHPFSPPKDPLPEPSALHKWYSQYPQYPEAFKSTYHPLTEYHRMKRERLPPAHSPERSPAFVDREVLARSVPFNRQVSTICRDDSYDDDADELGLLPDLGDDLTPCDYAAIQRQEHARREERIAREIQREKEERGPSLCEAKEMLERVREREYARRAELEADQLGSFRAPMESAEQRRERYQRVMERAGRVDLIPSWAGPSTSNEPCPRPADDLSMTSNCEMLQDIQMDMDMDAIDMIDECDDD